MANSHDLRLRHATFYLNVLRKHEKLFSQSFLDRNSAINALTDDWANIEMAQKRCAELVGEDEEATALCCDYPTAGDRILHVVSHPNERILWRHDAIKAAEALNFRAGLSAHFGNLALAHMDLGQPRRAIQFLREALKLARELNDRPGESIVLNNLGSSCVELGHVSSSRSVCQLLER